MGDPYRERYRGGRGTDRYESYPPDDYYPPPGPPYGRGSGPPPPIDPGYDPRVYAREPIYDRPGAYDMPPPRGVPRNDYPSQPLRPDDYSRRVGAGDYRPPQAPRGSVPRDPGYPEMEYYPPPTSERHRQPPSRDYDRYPPETYRGEDTRRRVRRDDVDYDRYPPEAYDTGYYEDPAATGRRPGPPPIEYTRGPYDADVPTSRSRRTRDPGVKIPPTKSSPEAHDEEFTLPAEGIDKSILQKYITRFLGNDATSRGPMLDKELGLIYRYSAYRQFTSEQIRDLKKYTDHLSDPGYARGREGPGPVMPSLSTTRPSGRRNTDDDPMIMTDMSRDDYIYSTTANPGSRVATREIRAGRSPHDAYGASYHDPPARHTRAPIEARQGQDEDDEMED
ncbi:hypothetical protein TWF696_001018 [Orbilia brochopaga]|uniref:Uncharacterized protein n=1 Tax=Orbilia brochopaga TaxID=3140254 RepID=A0AAV9VJE9_9PEZI